MSRGIKENRLGEKSSFYKKSGRVKSRSSSVKKEGKKSYAGPHAEGNSGRELEKERDQSPHLITLFEKGKQNDRRRRTVRSQELD